MFKRDEVTRMPVIGRDATGLPGPGVPAVASAHSVDVREIRTKGHMDNGVINIGKSVVIEGQLNGSEDLTVEGSVDGTIELRDHVLTIGLNGKIKAEVFAKVVVVFGEVIGNITASEKVDIRDNGSVEGNIVSPRVVIAEGSQFRGSVEMQRKPLVIPVPVGKSEVKPAPVPVTPPETSVQRLVGV